VIIAAAAPNNPQIKDSSEIGMVEKLSPLTICEKNACERIPHSMHQMLMIQVKARAD